MKKILLLAVTSTLLLLLLALKLDYKKEVIAAPVETIGCAPTADIDIPPDSNGKFAPVFPGWGNHSYIISTKNDSAQFYFNQGLSFYYGYHAVEAIASFKEAARFDEDCPIAYWGQALAMGPNINGYPYKMPAKVFEALQQMNQHTANASLKEKALIEVMNKRYAEDTSAATRIILNRNYANGLKTLMEKYTDDLDLKTFYIDAIMLEHPWDFWYNNGKPKEWTPELVNLCESILKADPHHPAALHYYIHIVEASHHPELALHSAEVLKDLMPGIAH